MDRERGPSSGVVASERSAPGARPCVAGLDPLDPPTGAGLGNGSDVLAFSLPVVPTTSAADGDGERRVAGGFASRPHVSRCHVLPGAAVGRLAQTGAVPPEGAFGRSLVSVAADPYRDPRSLHRLWAERQLIDGGVLAPEAERLASTSLRRPAVPRRASLPEPEDAAPRRTGQSSDPRRSPRPCRPSRCRGSSDRPRAGRQPRLRGRRSTVSDASTA